MLRRRRWSETQIKMLLLANDENNVSAETTYIDARYNAPLGTTNGSLVFKRDNYTEVIIWIQWRPT
jgi:hypothetical protein